MDMDKELQHRYSELEALRSAIQKALANAHIESYSAAGNSADYRELKSLRDEERKLMQMIKQLELKKRGKKCGVFISPGFYAQTAILNRYMICVNEGN